MLSPYSIAAIVVGSVCAVLLLSWLIGLIRDYYEEHTVTTGILGFLTLAATVVLSICGGLADHPKVFNAVEIKTLAVKETTKTESSGTLVGGLIGPFVLGKVSKVERHETIYYYVFWRELENEKGSYKLETIECEKTYIKPYAFSETSEYKTPTMVTARAQGDVSKHYTLIVPEDVSYQIFSSFDELHLLERY